MEGAYIVGRTGAARRGVTRVDREEGAHRGRSAREDIDIFGRGARIAVEAGGGALRWRRRRGQAGGERGARATGQSPLPAGSCSIHGYVVREDFPRKTGSVIARRGSGPVASHGNEGESEPASDEVAATAAAAATTATTTATGVPSGAAPGW